MRIEVRVVEVQALEREVRLRLPFRFGRVTLSRVLQLYLRVRVAGADGKEAWGKAAELLVPKWFDKDPRLTDRDNAEQLRRSVQLAVRLYLGESKPHSPFELSCRNHAPQLEEAAALGLNSLVGSFGPALLDRAVMDAACRLAEVGFYRAIRHNLAGVRSPESRPELSGFEWTTFLKSLRPRNEIHARHTVGLLDALHTLEIRPEERLNDGLPESLQEILAVYGHRYFKVKLSGEVEADLDRLKGVASVLDGIPERYCVTLDGNEQFGSAADLMELWRRMGEQKSLGRFQDSVLLIEQPLERESTFAQEIGELSRVRPVIIDESDSDLGSFPRARAVGYRGVSSKSCKGFYKSLLNLAGCTVWNRREGEGTYLLTAEDLTIQPGVGLQQDLALASILGLEHCERNGHHYVDGMAGLPEKEQQAFLTAHPDLYHRGEGPVRVTIRGGRLSIESLDCIGFATAAEPDWSRLRPVAF